MFRTLTVAGVVLAAVGVTAIAAPAQATTRTEPASRSFTVTCSTGRQAVVTLPVPGSFAPGLVVGSDALLIPYRFDYRWTGADGSVLSRSEAVAEPGPVPADAITCELPPTTYADGTSLSFTVSAVVR